MPDQASVPRKETPRPGFVGTSANSLLPDTDGSWTALILLGAPKWTAGAGRRASGEPTTDPAELLLATLRDCRQAGRRTAFVLQQG